MDKKESRVMLERDHKEILQEADHLYDVLTNLRYEGKVNFGKNVTKVGKILKFFNEKLIPHIAVDETIFPFLETHIPKLEPMIRLLQGEHKEIKVNLEVLSFLLEELVSEKDEHKHPQMVERLRDKGIYTVYLLRNHIQVEDEGVYRTIEEDLKPEEKKELLRKIQGNQVA